MTDQLPRKVEPIILTQEEKKEYDKLPIPLKTIELTNMLLEAKLCGYSMTFKNGWHVSFKNKRFAKQLGIPMP